MKRSSLNRIRCHDFANVLSAQTGIALLGLITFLALIPIPISVFHDTSIFNLDYTHMQLKFQFCVPDIAAVLPMVTAVYGAILGHCIGGFLLSRKDSNFYLSLGISRRNLLMTRILAGVGILCIVIGVPMAVALGLNLYALGNYTGMLGAWLAMSVGLLLVGTFFLILFFLGCCIAGNRTEAIIYSVAAALLPTAVQSGANSAAILLLKGTTCGRSNYFGTVMEEGLLTRYACWNPLLFLKEGITTYCSFSRMMEQAVPDPVNGELLVGWTIATGILLLFTDGILQRRKAENIGIYGKSPAADALALLTLGTGAFGVVMKLMTVTGAFAAVLTGLLISVFACLILELQFLKMKLFSIRTLGPLVAVNGVIAGCCAVFAGGGFGYSNYLPDAQEVASAQISYVGNPSYLPVQVTGSSTGTSFYTMSTISVQEKESVELVRQLHQNLISASRPLLKQSETSFGETGVPYDISISYCMKNGELVNRYYDAVTLTQLSDFLKMEDQKEVKQQILRTVCGENEQNFYTSEAYRAGKISLSDPLYSDVTNLELSEEQRSVLLKALATDLEEQESSELYYSSQPVRGVILFTHEQETATFSYSLTDAVINLTDAYENTMNLMKQWNLISYFQQKKEVESITIQKFTPYSTVAGLKEPMSMYFMGYTSEKANHFVVNQDFGKLPVITESEQIQELLPLMRNGYFMSDGGYLACVKLRDSEQYAYLFLPEAFAPDYIRKKF